MKYDTLWHPIKTALLLALFCGSAHAVTLSATAYDLPDVVTGEDLWRLDYNVAGPLAAFNGVNLTFPFADFAGLVVVTSPAPDVSHALSPADASSSIDGLLTLTAQADLTAAYTTTLSLNFTKLASGAFSPQAYEVFDDSFNIVNSGTLTIAVGSLPPVPEPSKLALLTLGAVVMWRLHRRRSKAR